MEDFDLLYSQSSGALYLCDLEDRRVLFARCYSGRGSAKNDPDAERQIAVGPIPRGHWRVEDIFQHKTLGPVSIRLVPVGHDAFGRTGFFIHGDSRKRPGDASSGCIIAPRPVRDAIKALGIRRLTVVT